MKRSWWELRRYDSPWKMLVVFIMLAATLPVAMCSAIWRQCRN